MTAHIAVLGTGKMGSAIARRLADLDPGIALWNRTPERAQQLHLGRVAPTAAEAVRGADVVISCLTGPAAIRAAYLAPGGALEARTAAVYVEMSTAGAAAAELAPLVEQAGGRLVEAPILGAPALVAAERAAILVGGDGADVDRVAPILERLGEVHRVGPLGSASRLKLVANSMLATVVVAAAELQVAGEEAGLDPAQVFWVLARLAPVLEPRRAGYLEDRHEPAQFTVRDLRKDLDLALGILGGSTGTLPVTSLVRSQVDAATVEWGNLDITAMIRSCRAARAGTPGPDRSPGGATEPPRRD